MFGAFGWYICKPDSTTHCIDRLWCSVVIRDSLILEHLMSRVLILLRVFELRSHYYSKDPVAALLCLIHLRFKVFPFLCLDCATWGGWHEIIRHCVAWLQPFAPKSSIYRGGCFDLFRLWYFWLLGNADDLSLFGGVAPYALSLIVWRACDYLLRRLVASGPRTIISG